MSKIDIRAASLTPTHRAYMLAVREQPHRRGPRWLGLLGTWLALLAIVALFWVLVMAFAIPDEAHALDFASDTPPVSGLVTCPKVGRVTYASVFVQVGPSPNGIVVATACSATANPVATLECRCTGLQRTGCGLEYYHDWLTTAGSCQ